MVPYVKHDGSVAVSEQDALAHSAVQEGGGVEATALSSEGVKEGYLKGVHNL